MILEAIFAMVKLLVQGILFIIPSLPSVPASFTTSVNSVLSTIFDNGGSLIGLFVRPITFVIVAPILLVIINFEYIYKIVMWIITKIPLGIKR